jgi:hypothetical protein
MERPPPCEDPPSCLSPVRLRPINYYGMMPTTPNPLGSSDAFLSSIMIADWCGAMVRLDICDRILDQRWLEP